MNLWLIFLTGLTVGGLTCLAVQGGLLASTIAAREEGDLESGSKQSFSTNRRKHTILATVAFLTTKLLTYTLLGFMLGAFGGVLNISSTVQTTMQFIAGLYMVVIALNLLNVHPIFRYAVIQPPRFLTRTLRNQSKSKDLFAPAFLGAMTIFIPCGTTLAMEALAISSGNALFGALIMFFFVLGTLPVFFGIGFLTTILGDNFQGKFLKLAGLIILYLGITSANGALVAAGLPITLPSVTIDLSGNGRYSTQDTQNSIPITQNTQIDIKANGYFPNYIRVKRGETVNLTLRSTNAFSCASAFRIPSLGISKNLQPNDTQLISFVPTQTGRLQFNCSMGMYRGVIEVI
ncbi:MAG: sulfite exporter TauE/SafE family protein [Candidatus Daviesbacteria bacterium]|nr:sulfite exporter TauE/SafE family protein [Candidatus Daviesbacteria bacterium]